MTPAPTLAFEVTVFRDRVDVQKIPIPDIGGQKTARRQTLNPKRGLLAGPRDPRITAVLALLRAKRQSVT